MIACDNSEVFVLDLKMLAENDLGPSATVVFLLELRATFLADIPESNYALLQSVLSRPGGSTLWVSQQVLGELSPHQHLADGLGRTLGSEDSTRKFVTLAMDSCEPDRNVAQWTIRLTEHIRSSPIDTLETHYVVEDGVIRIPRIAKDITMNTRVHNSFQSRRKMPFRLPLEFPASFQLDPHQFREEEPVNSTPLEPDAVVVNVKAFGLPLYDTIQLGTECAGIVEKAGSSLLRGTVSVSSAQGWHRPRP
ncbi:hypothetical protein BDV06DRAFT_201019 [Aspergillus oleicola]